MAIQHYLSKMVGSGTEDDPFRPKIADYGFSFGCVCNDSVALVEVRAELSANIDADIIALPQTVEGLETVRGAVASFGVSLPVEFASAEEATAALKRQLS